MEILHSISGMVSTNQYYVLDSAFRHWVVDAPDGNDLFVEEIRKRTDRLDGILLTHGHFDHTLGLTNLLKAFPGTPVYLREEDRFMMEGGNRKYLSYMGINPRRIQEPEGIVFQDYPETLGPFLILHTPGHTMGSVCLYAEDDAVLFSGDTLFWGGEGRTDLGGSYRAIVKSLEFLLSTFPEKTSVLTGHGKDTTIGAEKAGRA